MPKKTIVVRKKPRVKVDASKIKKAAAEKPAAEEAQEPLPEAAPEEAVAADVEPVVEEVVPEEEEIEEVEEPVAEDVEPVEEHEPVAARPATARKPPVKPLVVGKRPKTSKRERPVVPVGQPVYEDAVDGDRLTITQQVIDLPDELKQQADVLGDNYTGLLNTIYDAVVITTHEGAILEVNARAIEKFGAERETLCEMNVTELIAGSDDHLLVVLEQNAVRHKFTVLEATCIRHDDTRFPAEIAANVFSGDEDGKLCFFIRDVTRRKEAEKSSQALAAQLAQAEAGGPGPNLTGVKELLYELNDPIQVLLCLADLDKNSDYQKQLQRVTEVVDELMKLADGIETPKAEKKAEPEESDADEPKPCDRTRVLIVDTQEMVAKLLAKTLKSVHEDLDIDTASKADRAVELFCEHHHAIVMLDLLASGMQGKEAFDRFCDECEKRTWDLPSLVFCSSQDADPWVRDLTGEGSPHAWLRKPFQAADLTELVTGRLG